MATEDYSLHSPFSLREGEYLEANYGGAGGVVEDAIVDGETTKAPSQNAVFDALALKAPTANPTFTGTVAGVTKTHVGLANVDNTTDVGKPVSTAQQAALDLKADLALVYANALAAGHSTMDRHAVHSNVATIATQNLRLMYFTAIRNETVTQVRQYSGGTAAGATPTLVRYGLYSVAGNGDLTLIASTPNDTALFAAAQTEYTKSFSASVGITKGNRYAIGLLIVTSAATPTFPGNNTIKASVANEAPRIAAAVASQTDLPSSVANGSLSTTGQLFYIEVLPA